MSGSCHMAGLIKAFRQHQGRNQAQHENSFTGMVVFFRDIETILRFTKATNSCNNTGDQHHCSRVIFNKIVNRPQNTAKAGHMKIICKTDYHKFVGANGKNQKTGKNQYVQHAGDHVAGLPPLQYPDLNKLNNSFRYPVKTIVRRSLDYRRQPLCHNIRKTPHPYHGYQ